MLKITQWSAKSKYKKPDTLSFSTHEIRWIETKSSYNTGKAEKMLTEESDQNLWKNNFGWEARHQDYVSEEVGDKNLTKMSSLN